MKDTKYMNLDVAFISIKFHKNKLYNIGIFTKKVSINSLKSSSKRIASSFEYIDADTNYDSQGNPTVTIRDKDDNILTTSLVDNTVLLMFMSHKYRN